MSKNLIEAVKEVIEKEGNWITTKEIAEKLQKSPKTIQKIVKSLKDQGLLLIKEERLMGNAKRFYYKLSMQETEEKPEKTKPAETVKTEAPKMETPEEKEAKVKTFEFRLNGVMVTQVTMTEKEIKEQVERLRNEFRGAEMRVKEESGRVIVELSHQFKTKG